MVEYKLKYKYPSLPENWEVGMLVGVGDFDPNFYKPCSSKYSYATIYREYVEKFPEFWEKVEEKEYEILSYECLNPDGTSATDRQIFVKQPSGEYMWYSVYYSEKLINIELWNNKTGGFVIHSVKRLSDGEVFTVGDSVQLNIGIDRWWKSVDCIISKFIEKDSDLIFIIKEIDATSSYPNTLERWRKTKKPLFITEYGVEIFEEAVFYTTNTKYIGETWNPIKIIAKSSINFHIYKNIFLTKEAAEKYVDENKPKYSKKDILKLINETYAETLKEYIQKNTVDIETYSLIKLSDKIHNDKAK